MIVFLDSGPLGLLVHARGGQNAMRCREWCEALIAADIVVCIPEIADYEVRRELIRLNFDWSIRRLNALEHSLSYRPITTAVMRLAAEYWAHARSRGRPTTDRFALDGDAILSAQALETAREEHDAVTIATTNVGHLSRFADARPWQDIQP